MKRHQAYRHAPALPMACGGVGLPLILMVPALALLGLVIVAAT